MNDKILKEDSLSLAGTCGIFSKVSKKSNEIAAATIRVITVVLISLTMTRVEIVVTL